MEFKPRAYSTEAIRFLLDRGGSGGLFLDPGLGKTGIILALIKLLIAAELVERVLVVAPLRAIYSTWPAEIAKWDQFRGLSCAILHGPRKARAVKSEARILLINVEGLKWGLDALRGVKVDLLVVDESTKFKSPRSKRFKLLRKTLARFPRRIVMTGTPAPNSYQDIWSQVFLLDGGEALGTSFSRFRDLYFEPVDYMRFDWRLRAGADAAINRKIAPLVLRVDDSVLDLPELRIHDIPIDLDPKAARVYREMERRLFAEVAGADHFARSAAHKYGLCRQIAAGGFYSTEEDPGFAGARTVVEVHNQKTEALVDLIDELAGKPVLVAHVYRHEITRLRKALGPVPYLGAETSGSESRTIIDQWNRGEIRILLAQAASISHGLNLQGGGNDIAWITLTDAPEDYDQLNRRIYRPGVSGRVRIHRLIARGTIDEVVAARLEAKADRQSGLLEALKRYQKQKEEAEK
jgi:SNF2 family DNA or RNA helicase